MADISLSGAAQSVDSIQSSYGAQVQRRRLYGGLMLLLFVVLMVSGFNIADDRNAGGFWNGLHQIGDYPADVLSEAWEKRADLPVLIAKYFPALVETVNIAAVSTLIGAIGGLVLSMLGTRGLARWPRLIPLFRRISDIMRAVPEIVIALVLIFVLGGGPVPAMIAIAIHTAGALGKMFSEVAENTDLKPVEGLASTGATWSQRMLLGVLPQVAPNFVSYALLRFEINIRASAILGFVGTGGIGYELRNAMGWGQGRFDDAAAIFILLFGTIVFFDQVSSRYRNRLTEGQAQ
ncbi:phosphonate ABC transporter, permease protein PhnE [Sulfitobacter sp. M57]|uniref:phosphonate ABC transporter, permease protein PhnE n=1 Tax=unclassified Sulfitobacter TaxID=196795 RepID=UPI0023E283E4|nr:MULTISPECIES: phosphonate ABC transporter, permease protein PhnE [unclassified Sulfitobacter]MDF3415125.1 phosphonate ABC transporter, permease protein PhnE [Sulfitobacter sp. KE5]MDF3422606.1 phosphonate ABC transporter, permease protein PhnE [Sulfitobacter sp. KE43]MDF3433671.1 phosphonate ABC transporter, permease protein PhnE [Sulfitobacter sp. KE42]MDF3459311.1 phosphonate ABC transporter, permease protein PhnE [Sulfitobacter sp. S74]MDF3463210.1 phosphonate ABC transporter, permease p